MKPIETLPARGTRDESQGDEETMEPRLPSAAEQKLKTVLQQSAQGHAGKVASRVGVYPA